MTRSSRFFNLYTHPVFLQYRGLRAVQLCISRRLGYHCTSIKFETSFGNQTMECEFGD